MRAPLADGPAIERENWSKLQAGQAPFDGVPAAETSTLNAVKRGTRRTGGGADRMELVFCRKPIDEPKAELQAACGKFEAGLRL